MTKKYIRIAELIYKDKVGIATEKEKQELLDWVAESDLNQQLFEELAKGIGLSKSYEEYRLIHRQQVWAQVEQRIAPRHRGLSLRWLGYAASVVVFVVAGWFLFTLTGREEDREKVKQVAIITPGERKAILHLESGKRVVLGGMDAVIVDDSLSGKIEQVNDALVYQAEAGIKESGMNVLEIPNGGEFNVTLADGTRVWLNAGTKLTYPVAFVGAERRVELEGEGYFEVKRDSLHPFIVETRGQVLTVLGTSFAIRAYEDENMVLTTLESGRVNIASGEEKIELVPGFQSCLAGGKIVVNKVKTSLYTSWHKGIFEFADQPLKEILRTLSRWYDIEIFYESSELGDIRFTGELRRYDDIQELLDRLQELKKVRFDIQDRRVAVLRY